MDTDQLYGDELDYFLSLEDDNARPPFSSASTSTTSSSVSSPGASSFGVLDGVEWGKRSGRRARRNQLAIRKEIIKPTKTDNHFTKVLKDLMDWFENSENNFTYLKNKGKETELFTFENGQLKRVGKAHDLALRYLSCAQMESIRNYGISAAVIWRAILSREGNEPIVMPRHHYAVGPWSVNFESPLNIQVKPLSEADCVISHSIPCQRPIDLSNLHMKGPWDFPTPETDYMLQYQGYDADSMLWFYAFMGRLFYDIGSTDNWGRSPFLFGKAGTGKSTFTSTLVEQMLFPPNKVMMVDNSKGTFNWSPLVEGDIWIMAWHEVEDTHNERTLLSAVFGGESIRVHIKNVSDTPLTRVTQQSILDGNSVFEFGGEGQKSIKRRMVIFPFGKSTSERDSSLKENAQANAACFFIKCLLAYRDKLVTHGRGEINPKVHLPPFLVHAQGAMTQTNWCIEAFEHYVRLENNISMTDDNGISRSDLIKKIEEFAYNRGALTYNSRTKPFKRDFNELLRHYKLETSFVSEDGKRTWGTIRPGYKNLKLTWNTQLTFSLHG